ncbi:MAG: NAD-dependent epimerase/dehydratase family protein [Bacteroidota bacterium]
MPDFKKVILTGSAGFIGYHLTNYLLNSGYHVTGIDSINNYYDVSLKLDRLKQQGILISDEVVSAFHSNNSHDIQHFKSSIFSGYDFYLGKIDLEDHVNFVFKNTSADIVINLAAQAGVRYSLSNPRAYIESNIAGFLNILEATRNHSIKHLLYASSSSVYGLNEKLPFSSADATDHPISLYGATKKSNELMAHSYSHLYKIPTTGLRFFTVYGPWGRPDMALYSFTKSIIEEKPIELFNNGDMIRDFTYINDICESIVRLIPKIPIESYDKKLLVLPSSSTAPYRIFNIGNNQPINLKFFLSILETKIGKKANIISREMQPGDVYATQADVTELASLTGYTPSTPVETGINEFVDWFRRYYNF